jgi:hypothetical protein
MGWEAFGGMTRVTKTATVTHTADFGTRAYEFGPNVTDFDELRVVYRLYWYGPDGTLETGHAYHIPRWYQARATGEQPWGRDTRCRSSDPGPTLAGSDEGPYGTGVGTGTRGPSWILDHSGPDPEFPAVTCTYDDDGALIKLTARRPIMLAKPGPGIAQQDVSWRIQVQIRPTGSTGPWTLHAQSSATRRLATEVRWPDFASRSVGISPGVNNNRVLRVVYQLTWYQGTSGQVAGTIKRWPYWYKVAGGNQYREEACPSYVGLGRS